MNRDKHLFSLLLGVSIVFHTGFYFLSTKISLKPYLNIEKSIKKAFRMRNITFMREVKMKSPHYNIKAIQFPNIENQILQEAQDLIFDEAPYKEAEINSEEEVLRSRQVEKDINYFLKVLPQIVKNLRKVSPF